MGVRELSGRMQQLQALDKLWIQHDGPQPNAHRKTGLGCVLDLIFSEA